MKCPLLAIAEGPHAAKEQIPYPDCLEEECAWWMHQQRICAIYSLAWRMMNIDNTLSDIHHKIPKGGN